MHDERRDRRWRMPSAITVFIGCCLSHAPAAIAGPEQMEDEARLLMTQLAGLEADRQALDQDISVLQRRIEMLSHASERLIGTIESNQQQLAQLAGEQPAQPGRSD